MKKIFYTAFSAFILLSSCSKVDDLGLQPEKGHYPEDGIVRVSTHLGALHTRSVATYGGTDLSLSLDYGELDKYTSTNIKWENTTGSWTPSLQMLWKDKDTHVGIYSYAPYVSDVTNIESVSFSVHADQSAGIVSSDLVGYNNRAFVPKDNLSKGFLNLEMSHRLSLINVSLTFGDQWGGNNPAIKSVTIGGTKLSTTYNAKDGKVTEASGTATAITTYKNGSSYEAVIIPQTITSGTKLVTITLDDYSVYTYTTTGLTFVSNTLNTINLRVGKDQVTLASPIIVNDWTTGTPLADGETEEIIQYIVVNGIKVAKGNLIADGANGCKIGAPEDGGLYFQFGSLIGWSGGVNGDGTGRVTYRTEPALSVVVKPVSCNNHDNIWISNDNYYGTLSDFYFNYRLSPYETAGTDIRGFDVDIYGAEATGTLGSGRYAALGVGDPCTYYLGTKWRLPTNEEWKTILGTSTEVDWSNTNGWSPKGDFGYSSTTSYAIHTSGLTIPAAGSRYYMGGSLSKIGELGIYWSSSVSDELYGYCMCFIPDAIIPQGDIYRSFGYPVRCVKE